MANIEASAIPGNVNAERALSRYADRVYRLALLREPDSQRAARATINAFQALDWSAVELDDQLEGRLLAALPPVGRTWRTTGLPGIPAPFWRLPAATRLALGLRLTRGFDTTAISTVLGRAPDEVRRMLVDAITTLAGDRPVREECRRSRMARLDEQSMDRAHLLTCADCQAAAPRWEQTEQVLAEEIIRTTGAMMLPRPALAELRLRLQGGSIGNAPFWKRPALLQAFLVVVVIAAVAVLVVPRRSTSTAGGSSRSARDLLEQAIVLQGAAPKGTGVLHRRYAVDAELPRGMLIAATWHDAEAPKRHRMQLNIGEQVQEWQAGDGQGRLRYLLMNQELCSPGYGPEALALRTLHIWNMDEEAQAGQAAARWRYGVWALPRHYLEAALAADRLRSLGTVAGEDSGPSGAMVTLAAEGETIEGTLLLRLDAESGELREVREVVDDNGVARSRTPWRLLDEEWLTREAATRAGIFTATPLADRPPELLRTAPLLDPACPALVDEAVVSLPRRLAGDVPGPSFFALGQTPPQTERIVAASPPVAAGRTRAVPGWSTLTYLGPGKRLVLRGTLNVNLGFAREGAEIADDWRVHFTAAGRQALIGVAGRALGGSEGGALLETLEFYAEGWSREELIAALGTARQLRLEDVVGGNLPLYDPAPIPAAVRAVLGPALSVIERPVGQTVHGIFEYQMRQAPQAGVLLDPYHRSRLDGLFEFWATYGADSQPARYRTIHEANPKQLRSVQWGGAGERRVYYPGLGVVEHMVIDSGDPLWRIDARVRDVLRFGLFDVADSPPGTVTLRGVVPVTATDILSYQRSQHQSRSAALYWPWMADLEFDFVTFSCTFDQRTGQLLEAETWADVAGRLTMLDRLTVRRLEILPQTSAGDLDYEPPAGTPTLDVHIEVAPARGTRLVTLLEEVVEAAPAPLWGWRDPAVAGFTGATLAAQEDEPHFSFQQIDDVLDTGAAVRLRYELPSGEEIVLLEGRAPYLRLSLLQTPPEWTQSTVHTIHIGDDERTVWLMRDDADRRRAILELGETLIMATFSDRVGEAAIIRLLVQLEPLP